MNRLEWNFITAAGARQVTESFAEEERVSSEQKRNKLRSDLAGAKGLRAEEEERLTKHQSELDNVNATLRQVELYNEEMKGEVAIARRYVSCRATSHRGREKKEISRSLHSKSE